jgi:putative tryptophan/tyrosine transport system substrate-binding protein
MRRRDVVFAVIGGAAACWPRGGGAQQMSGVRRIGVLMPLGAEDPQGQARLLTFRESLQMRGWVEGSNLRIDVRWGPGDVEKYRQLAAELVALTPDIILAGGGLVVAPLQAATRRVPIVFTATVDPIALGYVQSLSRPGGNTTGFINFEYGLCGKWLEKLHQIAPRVNRVAVLRDPTGPGNIGAAQYHAIETVAPQFGIEVSPIDVNDRDRIERGVASHAAETNGGLIITASTFATVYRDLIIALAARHRLPAIYPVPFYVTGGGLISYGPVFLDQYRRAAEYVDLILRGAMPGDLSVEAPKRFEMAVNLKTAKALGLDVPRVVWVGANQVIE